MPHEVTVIKGRRFPTCRHCKGDQLRAGARRKAPRRGAAPSGGNRRRRIRPLPLWAPLDLSVNVIAVYVSGDRHPSARRLGHGLTDSRFRLHGSAASRSRTMAQTCPSSIGRGCCAVRNAARGMRISW
jgi:hypothetical protein